MKDPLRLRDDPDVSTEIRNLLRHGQKPPAIDPAVQASIGAQVGALGASPVLSGKMLVWIGSLGMLGIGLVGYLAQDETPDATETVVVAPAMAPPTVASPPTAPIEVAEVLDPAPALVETPSPEPRSETRPTATADRLAEEAALLERARAALSSEPTVALRETNRHRRSFPRGQLRSARELIAIDALHRLGRTERALRRAEALIRSDPDGIYAERARTLVRRWTEQ